MTKPVDPQLALALVEPVECRRCHGNECEPGRDVCDWCDPPEPTTCRRCDGDVPCNRRSCIEADRYESRMP